MTFVIHTISVTFKLLYRIVKLDREPKQRAHHSSHFINHSKRFNITTFFVYYFTSSFEDLFNSEPISSLQDSVFLHLISRLKYIASIHTTLTL